MAQPGFDPVTNQPVFSPTSNQPAMDCTEPPADCCDNDPLILTFAGVANSVCCEQYTVTGDVNGAYSLPRRASCLWSEEFDFSGSVDVYDNAECTGSPIDTDALTKVYISAEYDSVAGTWNIYLAVLFSSGSSGFTMFYADDVSGDCDGAVLDNSYECPTISGHDGTVTTEF